MGDEKSKNIFWGESGSKKHHKRPQTLVYIFGIICLFFLVIIIVLISSNMTNSKDSDIFTENEIHEEECVNGDINKNNVFRKINEYRIDNSKDPLAEDQLLSEYASIKIINLPENGNDLSSDIYDWYTNQTKDDIAPYQETYSAVIRDSADSCSVINQIDNDKILKNHFLSEKYSAIGLASNDINMDVYLIIAMSLSSEERQKIDDENYIESEISRLEQSKNQCLDAIEQANATLQTCPDGFYQSCYDRVKETTDYYYEKIDDINEQIQEWRRKLVD